MKKNGGLWLVMVLMIGSLLMLGACQGQPVTTAAPSPTAGPGQAVSSDTPTALPTIQLPTPGGGVVRGEAIPVSIDILMMESMPVQVAVVAHVNLPNDCMVISGVEQNLEGNTFQITLLTEQPTDRACSDVIVPVEQRIDLEVEGLAAGVYTVDVGGVTGGFELAVDNVLPDGAVPVATGDPYPGWLEYTFDELGVRVYAPPEWQVTSAPGLYGFAPPDSDNPNWIAFSFVADVPQELDALQEALSLRYEAAGETGFTVARPTISGFAGVAFMGLMNICMDTYVPAYDLVHQIMVSMDSCDMSGVPIGDSFVILQSVQFFEATAPLPSAGGP